MLDAADIAYERVKHFSEVTKDPQAWANEFIFEHTFRNCNTGILPRTPVQFASFKVANPPAGCGTRIGELLWTGDFIDAHEVLRIGMINRIYPDDRLMEETLTFAKRLAAGPSEVIRMIKRATYQSSRTNLRTVLDLISSHMGVIRESKDGRDAFKKANQRFGRPA